jgi:hypothetical protein
VAVRWKGPWSVRAKKRGPRGSPYLTPLVERTGAELSGAPQRRTRNGLPYAQARKCRREGACSWAAWKMARRDTLLKAFLQTASCSPGRGTAIWVCVEGRAQGVPSAPRDTDAKLQCLEAGAQLATLMDCAQRSQAQPGFSDGYGPDTSRGFGEGEAIAVEYLWDWRQAAC